MRRNEEAGRQIHERLLWRRWVEDRDPRAREELVDLYMPVARRMASRYAGVSEPYDDLLQVASLGLLNSIDRFDPSLGTPFMGFAKPTIMGELKRHFRDKVWSVRVPRSLHDLVQQVERAAEEMTVELGRVPTVTELGAHLKVDSSEVLVALEAQHARSPLSFDSGPKDGEPDEWASAWLGAEDAGYEKVEDRLALHAAMPGLDEREAQILRLRFLDELPQNRIAERLGCSQMQISRVLRRTLDRLRAEMLPEP